MKQISFSFKLATASLLLIAAAPILHSQVPDCVWTTFPAKCTGENIKCGEACDGRDGDCEGYSISYTNNPYNEADTFGSEMPKKSTEVACSYQMSCYTDYLPQVGCDSFGSCSEPIITETCNYCSQDEDVTHFVWDDETQPCPET